MTSLIALLLYLGLTVLIWPPHPIARLLMIPLLAGLFWLKPRFDDELHKASKSKRARRAVLTLSLVAVSIRGVLILKRLFGPIQFLEDVAVVNAEAARLLFVHGRNPYSATLDLAWPPYLGFKYPPLQLFTYAPFTLLGGYRGIYFAHLLIYMAIAAVLFRLAYRRSTLHGAAAVFLLVINDPFATLCFNNGINDFLPVLLLLFTATSLHSPGRSHLPGPLLALTGLAKQLPGGLLVLPLLMEKRFKALLLAGLLALLACAPFIVASPRAFFENVVLFNFSRPVRDSSIQYFISPTARIVLQLTGIAFWAALTWVGKRKAAYSLSGGYGNIALGLTAFLLTTKMSQMHYWVWAVPFWILWMLSVQEPIAPSTATRPNS